MDPTATKTVDRILEAALNQRRLSMRYHSVSSGTEKTYRIDPYRLVYAQGGLYLWAYVPAYDALRTFAVQRIRHVTPLNESFDIAEELDRRAMSDSLGVHEGPTAHVEVEFAPQVAPFVVERIWHPSQTVTQRSDGSVIVALEVCVDTALTTWILGYGASARVLEPAHLADEIAAELSRARARYEGRDTPASTSRSG